MRTITQRFMLMMAALFFAGLAASAQPTSNNSKTSNKPEMKTYLIEREIPGLGKLTPEQLKGISQASCSVLKEIGPSIQWIQSYVTGDKLFCIYKAENEDLIREHAKKGGFPCNNILEIGSVISPATATN
jgi:hypothetical protein